MMKLRLALGVGALALLMLGLLAFGGFAQPSFEGRIVGAAGLPTFALDKGDIDGLYVCTDRGLWPAPTRDLDGVVFVHITQFTRAIDQRGRLFTIPVNPDKLRPGQRVKVWTTRETLESFPPQVYGVRIAISADPPAGALNELCHWSDGLK
jgi:hypothetical protein